MPTTAISRHKLRCKISVIEYRERFKARKVEETGSRQELGGKTN